MTQHKRSSQEYLESYPECFGNNLFDKLYRSVVGISGSTITKHSILNPDAPSNKRQITPFLHAGFLVYFENHRALATITAGHIVMQLKNAESETTKLGSLRILDRGLCPKDNSGVPLRLSMVRAYCSYLSDEHPDYGALQLPIYESQQIIASSEVSPVLTNEVASSSEEFEAYFMLGFPISARKQENIVNDGKKCHIRHHLGCPLLPVTPITDGQYAKRANGRFVAHIDIDDDPGVDDISGMSGGPVWGVRHEREKDCFVIKLVAIQSKWIKPARVIYAEYAQPFVHELENRFDSLLAE